MSIQCLKCGSEQITSKILPANGTQPQQTVVECLNCGNEWNPKDYNRLKNEKIQRENEQKASAWKAAFYRAVETNDMALAETLMNQSAELKSKFTNPKDAYEYLKKKDKTTIYIGIALFVFIVVATIFLMSGGV
jgi:hypothetical protein